MQIVIDIPERTYEQLKFLREQSFDGFETIIDKAVANGTPLPKGHGRLGDLSKVYNKLNDAQIEGTEEYIGLGAAKQIVCDAKTIIEAESEEEK